MTTSSNYAKFGPANPLTPEDIDPVPGQCVGNIMFTKSGVPGYQMQKDFCPRLMSQRCSVNWDNFCEAYLTDSNYDSGGFLHINKEFLSDVAKKKYCHLSNAPGTHCAKRCEAFLPEGQSSVQICENIGTQNWLDTKDEYDLGGNFPQSARLNPISPLYMGYCPEVCDASNSPQGSLGPNDPVLNNCIKHGACSQILMDLAYNVVKNGTSVTNPAFKKIINAAKLDTSFNPNLVTKVANSYGIPAQVAVDVLESAKYGVEPSLKHSVIPKMPKDFSTKGVVSPVEMSDMVDVSGMVDMVDPVIEGFYPPQKINTKVVVFGSILAVIALLLIWYVYKKLSR